MGPDKARSEIKANRQGGGKSQEGGRVSAFLPVAAIAAVEVTRVVKISFYVCVRDRLSGAPSCTRGRGGGGNREVAGFTFDFGPGGPD